MQKNKLTPRSKPQANKLKNKPQTSPVRLSYSSQLNLLPARESIKLLYQNFSAVRLREGETGHKRYKGKEER